MADGHVKEMKDAREAISEHAKLLSTTEKRAALKARYQGIPQNESLSERPYGSHGELSDIMGHATSRKSVLHQKKHTSKPLLRRPLGGLELVYHHAMSKGMDKICLMTKVSSTFPILPDLAEQALYCLAERHPLLRMTIQSGQDKASNDIFFQEMEEMRVDFLISSNKDDWLQVLVEESAETFDIAKGPLWKCRLILPNENRNTSSDENNVHVPQIFADNKSNAVDINMNHSDANLNDFVHEATFLYVWHHSIMDGGYVMRIFREFAQILDKVHTQSSENIAESLSLSLPPPLEHILVNPSKEMKKHTKPSIEPRAIASSSVVPDDSNPPYQILESYTQKFAGEIAHGLRSSPRNDCIYFEFDQKETAHIMRMCRLEKASTNGIFSAASLLAFIDLVYPSSRREHYRVPFDFMVDFRKHLPLNTSKGSSKYFQGVASIDIPMVADIRLNNRHVAKQEFWEMSRSFGIAIHKEIHSHEPFQLVKDFVEDVGCPKHQQPVGKSPYVLCLSNMGRMDGVLTGDIAKRMRLTGLHGHPTVLIENSPIFFVSIFLLNGKLCGNVSFCENYTSQKTAEKYLGLFKNQIVTQAKL